MKKKNCVTGFISTVFTILLSLLLTAGVTAAAGTGQAFKEQDFSGDFPDQDLSGESPDPDLSGDSPGTDESLYFLPVFYTSDTHGYLADTSGDDILYLLAYISDKVRDVRGHGADARKDRAVLLDGGDIYQGNTMSNLLQGQPLSAAYQIMGYDAVTIGNHEFDWGIENTVDSDGTMMDSHLEGHSAVNEIPVIISNLYHSGVPVSFADDYVILEKTAADKNGNEIPVRIGVIGFADDYSSSCMYSRFTGEDYSINPDPEIADNLAARLEGNGLCDATILLTHQEAGQAAGGLGENSVIDLVLGGHTHQIVNGTTDRGLLTIDTKAHFINKEFTGSVYAPDKAEAPRNH